MAKLYMVMKLCSEVTVNDLVTGEEKHVNIEGARGYIPVFESYEEAEDASDDGRFEIILIELNKKREATK